MSHPEMLHISRHVSEEKLPDSSTTGPFWFSVCSPGTEITPGNEVLSSGLCNLQQRWHHAINWTGRLRSIIQGFETLMLQSSTI